MEFKVNSECSEKQSSDCIVIGIFESGGFSPSAEKVNKISHGYLKGLPQNADLQGKAEQALLLHHVPHVPAGRVLLIGCGKEEELDERRYKKLIKKMINTLKETGAKNVFCYLTELKVREKDIDWKIRSAIEVIQNALYCFDHYKSTKTLHALNQITFIVTATQTKAAQTAIQEGIALAVGINEAKNLANTPPNICNPAYLNASARKWAEKFKNVRVSVVNEDEMKKLGMNAYLAVGQGSKNESLMSIIEYKSDKIPAGTKPIVLVGKGMTFDSGGISIKPSQNMDEMKYDMCGAATVFGVINVVAELNLPLYVIGVLAGAENMPGGNAYRPGDILTTLSGQTVEVLNTDAEGRLVLCDALTYVERFDPELVIDIATLTGACVVALGHHMSGLMSNHAPLAEDLLHASEQSGDLAWRLPLGEEYQEQLDSNFADMANIGGRTAGAITAGCFLSRFTHQYHWAHLDIAGTAWRTGKEKGATGRPVALLSQFLLKKALAQKKGA
ncbi:leucyl aminopeptidase [Candidatus Williamhamiltonella defendens]|uniref:Probable cytosol aminopeptidase n=1 Tax=Candidatus Hamiltonella defensa (Bemisia tabaci) TaxID=672795 RepID=A0A249DYC4_9ENTR|nr:leucyl aminopeptidase [Candidatus Hamiltonella defensa]ASX26359.1 leucyl aminopeptidase [Candidatus Hamiltonella defensa (Bemisia tabaci)]CED78324.1 Probable cytosol aminopeptidase [Candidatus Hamiltonella defensa (Bemisia tabaci)]